MTMFARRNLIAGLAGLAIGWAVARYVRAVLALEAEEEERELAETAVVITPGGS
jgi:hypothetical protein